MATTLRNKPAAKKAGGKKKKAQKRPFADLLWGVVKSAALQSAEVYRGLGSPDRLTRRMSRLFFISLAGVLCVSGLTLKRLGIWDPARPTGSDAPAAASHGPKGADGLALKNVWPPRPHLTMLDLGAFVVELKPMAGQRGPARIRDLADVTLVLECDSPETYLYLEQRLAQARNHVTNVFLMLDREVLLTPEGRQKLKAGMIERINGWLPQGKVLNVFFSKLIVA